MAGRVLLHGCLQMYGVVVEFYEDLKQHDKLPAIKEALGVDEKVSMS